MSRFAEFFFFGFAIEVVRLNLTRRVASRNPHRQALGQCQQFLATHLPAAQLVKVPSTAAAAEAVSTRADDDAADSAAICSKICLQLFGNIEILQEGIQDYHGAFEPNYFARHDPVGN
jgi:prephenate dehydratase